MESDRCHDCGTAPQWKHSPAHYCRRCTEKNGHMYATRAVLDVDKLDEVLGEAEAERIKKLCAHDCPW